MIDIPSGFWYTLQNNPKDISTYGIVADWCQDHDDEEQAKAWRWLEKHKKYPLKVVDIWLWKNVCRNSDYPELKSNNYPNSFLPQKVVCYNKKWFRSGTAFTTYQQSIKYAITRLIKTNWCNK